VCRFDIFGVIIRDGTRRVPATLLFEILTIFRNRICHKRAYTKLADTGRMAAVCGIRLCSIIFLIFLCIVFYFIGRIATFFCEKCSRIKLRG
jgi:hypothetical protein